MKAQRLVLRAAVLLAGAMLAGCISPVPLTLSESFANPSTQPPDAHPVKPARKAPSCALVVDSIADVRADKLMLGNVVGRPVHAPANVDAWLRNVIGGLQTRGIDVSFDANAAHEFDPLVASLTLRMAWVSGISSSKNATTLWRMHLRRGVADIRQADYRGTDIALNWSSGDGELQRMVDRAMGRALDLMAADVRAACAGQPPTS